MPQDEFITAYYSATQDFGHSSFFEGIPEKNEWQGQYPKPYFLLQRIFFRLFGASTLTVRLSVQIYVAVVSLMLFLIVREILDEASAWIAVGLYSFLAISVYLESLGLIFISSGAAFTVFFYFALREYRTGGIYEAAMTGIACGACYLVHYASYIAFPVLLAFHIPKLLQRGKRLAARNLCVSLGGILLVLAPFAAWSLRFGNYISHRANQVSLLTAEWSPHLDAIRKELTVLRDHLRLVLTSFAQDGIGGHGGYDFGHVAFFDRFSLALFLAGVLAGLVLAFRRTELFFVFLVILAAFFSGMAILF